MHKFQEKLSTFGFLTYAPRAQVNISLSQIVNVSIFFFYKNKMIFIHSNREITSFNTAKNVKDESANKLTASKLIAYNGIMPTKIYDKIKVTGISMVSGSATLMPKSLIEKYLSRWIKWTPQEDGKSNNAAQDDEQQTTTPMKSQRKNLDLCENHLFILK